MGEVISQQMQEEQHQDRLRVPNTSARGESAEVLYQHGDDDDENDVEEIQMTESMASYPQQYQPVRVRESLDEMVTVTESIIKPIRPSLATTDSFRNRNGTPPIAAERQSLIGAGPESLTIPSGQDKGMPHVDTNSDASSSSRRNEDESEQWKTQQDDSRSTSDLVRSEVPAPPPPTEASSAGALLGIHNIYIVLPQFLVSFLSSVVFAAIEPQQQQGAGEQPTEGPSNPETIGVMLRFGGIMAGIAALLSLRLWKQPRSVAPSHHL
ncbi:hypothetical protein BG011_007032 [Mortierella polycephala]|uniref:Uncharacterized protein n=1 Tax=Mortierella polycephala TaxID=41804 RepID=A0A9P6TZ78_9FUNG|nr:hypothetical protein BG011_007032 [Mortierella polycephala]